MLDIVYRDEHYIAVNKPHGLLVHRSKIANDVETFALQLLRNQIQQRVYPIHRIDRKTSGLLLFALHAEAHSLVGKQFEENTVEKKYTTILRGYTDDTGEIDYPLENEKGKLQDALTYYKTLARTEIDLPNGRYTTSRYSLVEARPHTGRTHQLRKHFAHILHPILGDRPHGCNKQNRLWKEKFDMTIMLLHAQELAFFHPYDNQTVRIHAPLSAEFDRVLDIINLSYPHN